MTDVGMIEADGVTIESSEETSEQMLAAVAPAKDEPQKFKAVKPIPDKEEKPKSATSKAASELGKLGGKAAAKAKAEREEAEEAKPTPKPKAETPDEGEPDEEEDDQPEVQRSRAAERVKQATREAAELKREKAKLLAENEELRKARPAAPAPQPQPEARPEAKEAPQKPNRENFQDWDEYFDARDEWVISEFSRKQAIESAQKAEREQVIGTVKTFQEAIAETIAEDPEFWDKVPEIHDTTPLGSLIVRAGSKAPGILTYLGEHPKEYARLSRLTDPYELIDGLGAIKGRIEAQREGATSGDTSSEERPGSNPEFSKAKPPARPPAGSPHIVTGDTGELTEDAPLSAFRADFGKRRAASRR